MKGVAQVCFGLFVCLTLGIPFFNKEFIGFAPFPFFNAMCVNIVAIPITFAVACSTHGIQTVMEWMSSNSKVSVYLALSGFFYAISSMMNMFCYSISDMDFIVVFSFIGVIIEVLLRSLFTGETIPVGVFASIVVISVGLFSMIHDFSWSTEKYSMSVQILAQIVLHVSMCLHSLCNSKLAKNTSVYEITPPIVSFWVHLVAAVPTTVTFLFTEMAQMSAITRALNFNYGNLIVFGAVCNNIFSITQSVLADFPGWGFTESISKLRCLPILLISYKVYHQTMFTKNQTIGIAAAIVGYVLYSLNFERDSYSRHMDSEGDTISLLKNGLDDNVFIEVGEGDE